MNIKDKQNKLIEAMKKDPDLKKHYKDIEALNEKQMKQLIKVCTLLNLDQIKQLKVLSSKVKCYEQDYTNNPQGYIDFVKNIKS